MQFLYIFFLSKIHFYLCFYKAQNQQDVKIRIPSWIPNCDHCILRWEWTGLHVHPTVEYYAQCVDVKIVGGDSKYDIPKPNYNMPGHLPTSGSDYPNYFNGQSFLTKPYGPALASGVLKSDGSPVNDDGNKGSPSISETTNQCARYPANPYITTAGRDAEGKCGEETGKRCSNNMCCSKVSDSLSFLKTVTN